MADVLRMVLTLLACALPLAVGVQAAVIPVECGPDGASALRRGAGWLHSLDADVPAAADLEPLHPRRVRVHPDAAQRGAARATALGIAVQVVVSDSWGYHADGDWPGDRGEWDNWEQHVRLLAQRARRLHLTWEWDIWNEPDVPIFWARSPEQHLATWERGVKTLRAVLPSAVVVGPSTADNRPETILAFLHQARKLGVLPDVVSWHELNDQTRFAIEEHVRRVREGMRRLGLPELPIQINEYLVRERSRIPGETVAALAQLERAGVEGVKSCWPDLDPGVDQAGNNQITGLVSADGRRPLWWLYAAYGEIRGPLRVTGPVDGWWMLAGTAAGHLRLFAGVPAGSPRTVFRCSGVSGRPAAGGSMQGVRLPALVNGAALPAPLPLPVSVDRAGGGLEVAVGPVDAGDALIIDIPLDP